MTKSLSSFLCALVAICSVWFMSSCVDETISTNPKYGLTFSTDTVSFDTLFSTIPSHTAIFKIYNKNKEALNISSIRLGGGTDSYFRFNVDGHIPSESNTLTDVLIRSNDSIFVFVELTAQNSLQNMPVMVLDSMEFITNGVKQNVKLMAYSQDAIIWRKHSFTADTTLTGEKPFLVFDYLYVPADVTLTINPGVTLYFHTNAQLVVDGTIKALGSADQPIVLRGDRFDSMADVEQTPYAYLPSQWGDVWLNNPNGEHVLNYTTIQGGDQGVFLIGANRATPKLQMSHSRIHMMGGYGLYAQNANVVMDNCELSNCAQSCFVLLGGSCSMVHTTIANYYPWSSRSMPAMVVANYAYGEGYKKSFPIQNAVFENSIIYGSLFEELSLQCDTTQQSMFNVLFSHCLLKAKQVASPLFYNTVWSKSSNGEGSDTVFVNTTLYSKKGYYNFQLDDASLALDKASLPVAQKYPFDLNNNNRLADGRPDIGAYEK